MTSENFFTFSEYIKKDINILTPSMEDYLEMIYRLSKSSGFTRINDLASALNVQPPSATKMVQKLSKLELVNYEKYGAITLESKGKRIGESLLKRHEIIENFLKLIGVCTGILEETEKIEHTINPETLKCISNLLNYFNKNLKALESFKNFSKI
ncbi:transcriptional regulator MntR [Clostridium botulinum]|uniref:Manganese transport regulator n=1 Tax=Clostridium botulinum TaxID=1491 RepID=A0A9Q1UW44_CLOBO|nr:transcriptional regulator MntR [Clostridium botulinum]AEB76261.1 iron-dependent transcriptional repressor [Clostridium botulinum BKT015925]KEI00687.1 Fur family transcriptional regulator [Clostridium botulinum C/D str. Sp77]KEI04185.1 Fur family transcriptional regulator [Clostridium botulinum D str. 16868]KLU75827.1 Fur family transcriptional regulator [Clostridium botulinum V891]KOA75348.1 Fur family transcriptional regulator [Clostridium botulinum]